MPSIASFSFAVQHGIIVPATQDYRLIAQPGVDGYGVFFGAYYSEMQAVEMVNGGLSDIATADLLFRQYRRLKDQYQPVNVVDQFGKTWANTLILKVDKADYGPYALTPLGVRMATRWELLVTAERPL